jgi:hypothetical protein
MRPPLPPRFPPTPRAPPRTAAPTVARATTHPVGPSTPSPGAPHPRSACKSPLGSAGVASDGMLRWSGVRSSCRTTDGNDDDPASSSSSSSSPSSSSNSALPAPRRADRRARAPGVACGRRRGRAAAASRSDDGSDGVLLDAEDTISRSSSSPSGVCTPALASTSRARATSMVLFPHCALHSGRRMRLTAELISRAKRGFNPLDERELVLRSKLSLPRPPRPAFPLATRAALSPRRSSAPCAWLRAGAQIAMIENLGATLVRAARRVRSG